MLQASIKELNHLLGNIDIYLLDQVLKGRFEKQYKILDAGCGEGRNLIYFVRNNYQVWGIDKNEDNIQMLKYLMKSINKSYSLDRFVAGEAEKMPYSNQQFDAVISSAVLHFAENYDHFIAMFAEHARVLKPGGVLFARMTTNVGIEKLIEPVGNGQFFLPDGSLRFLLDKNHLDKLMAQFNFQFIEPFKTVIVDEMRSMSTLVLKKS